MHGVLSVVYLIFDAASLSTEQGFWRQQLARGWDENVNHGRSRQPATEK